MPNSEGLNKFKVPEQNGKCIPQWWILDFAARGHNCSFSQHFKTFQKQSKLNLPSIVCYIFVCLSGPFFVARLFLSIY